MSAPVTIEVWHTGTRKGWKARVGDLPGVTYGRTLFEAVGRALGCMGVGPWMVRVVAWDQWGQRTYLSGSLGPDPLAPYLGARDPRSKRGVPDA